MPAIYYIEQTIQSCDNDELTVLVRWNGARMIVNIYRNLSSNVVENSLIDNYSSACLQDDDDEEDGARDQLLDAINEAGEALLDSLAPPSMPESSNLHSALFPQQFSFILVTVGGELKLLLEGSHRLEKSEIPGEGYKSAVPITGFTLPSTESPPVRFQLEVNEGLDLPRHQTTDILIIEKLLGDGYISHVSVDRRDMCAKVGKDFDGGALQRELDCLSRITTLNDKETSRVNIPNLLGLIETPNDGKVIGILEELVPLPESDELSSLAIIEDVSAIPKQRRKAWATQIQRTVDWLHDKGIIWGDGKADNVLIHPDSDEP